jgi:hypothetical protein
MLDQHHEVRDQGDGDGQRRWEMVAMWSNLGGTVGRRKGGQGTNSGAHMSAPGEREKATRAEGATHRGKCTQPKMPRAWAC